MNVLREINMVYLCRKARVYHIFLFGADGGKMDMSIVITIISGLIGVIGFFLVRAFNALDGKATKAELDEAKKDIEANKIAIAKIRDNYLTKEDFFREQTKTEKKLDEMMKILIDIKRGETGR